MLKAETNERSIHTVNEYHARCDDAELDPLFTATTTTVIPSPALQMMNMRAKRGRQVTQEASTFVWLVDAKTLQVMSLVTYTNYVINSKYQVHFFIFFLNHINSSIIFLNVQTATCSICSIIAM